MKKRQEWGFGIAVFTLGVLVIIVAIAFYFGLRGLF